MNYKIDAKPPSLIVLIFIISSSAMANVFVSPALPAIADYFNIPNNEVQNVTTYFVFGYLFGQILYAPLIKGLGIKKTLNFGITVYFLGAVACFAAYHFDSFLLLKYSRTLTGIGSGSGFVTIYSTINNIWYEKDARKITSYTSLSFVLIPGLAVIPAGFIVSYFGWQHCFTFLACWCILLFIMAQTLPETIKDPDIKNIEIRAMIKNYREVINLKILVFGLMYGIAASVFYVYVATGPLIVISGMGKSPEYFATSHILVIIGYVLGAIYSVMMSNRNTARKSIVIGSIIFAIPSVVLSVFHIMNYYNEPILFFLISAILYFSVPMLFANISVILLSYSNEKSTVSSILGFLHLVPAILFLKIMNTSEAPSSLLPLILCMGSVGLLLMINITRKDLKSS